MYVKKTEYARTVKRNEELEDQAICQYDLIKKLLHENAELRKKVKDLEWIDIIEWIRNWKVVYTDTEWNIVDKEWNRVFESTFHYAN